MMLQWKRKKPTFQKPAFQKPTLQEPKFQKPTFQKPKFQKPKFQKHPVHLRVQKTFWELWMHVVTPSLLSFK